MAESSLVNTVFEWIGKLGTGAGAIWGVVSIVKKREFGHLDEMPEPLFGPDLIGN